jgi:hypothetical protein
MILSERTPLLPQQITKYVVQQPFRCGALSNGRNHRGVDIEFRDPLRRSFTTPWGPPDERRVLEAVYKELRPANFSNELLEILPMKFPSFLSVLPVRGVFWSDMGLPRYVENAHKKIADRLRTISRAEASTEVLFRRENSLWKTA